MSIGILEPGSRWGRLTFVEQTFEPRVYDNGTIRYVDQNCQRYVFLCECGQKFRVWASEWKGKRHQKDCGCGLADEDGLSVNVCASIPVGLRRDLQKAAHETGRSLSRTIVDLLRAGLRAASK